MNKTNVQLLVIDPQKDFCSSNGSLFVPGADQDMVRLADFLVKNGRKLSDIHVTLDTHHFFDVAHPVFWVGQDGKHPAPFTIITQDDVAKGTWRTSVPALQTYAEGYVTQLAKNGRYPLCVWPPHCLIGSEGYKVEPVFFTELLKWEEAGYAYVDYVTKGSNFLTEHYSAVQADVPDPNDPSTQLNTKLIQTLQDADVILIAGEARSHCVANTITDIANNFGEENIKKFILLEDCTSDVPGFETYGEGFIKDMTARGMKVAKSTEFII